MDWFRKKSWSDQDEEEFFRKLDRARCTSRAQYLKIQGIVLLQAKDDALLDVAERLLKLVLADYPDDMFQRSSTLHTLGEIEVRRERFEKATEYFELALEAERKFPQVTTQAFLDFAELVVKQRIVDKCDAVETLINERASSVLFPIQKYKAYSILSIINSFRGRTDQADRFAKLANEYANAETSGFRYHKSLGLVERRDEDLDRMSNRGS